jgi:L-ornithine N5-oxygenase
MEHGHHHGPVSGAEVYDVVGIGFGPANLALAIAMEEAAPEAGLRRLFLEAKPSYVWHPGMLLEGSMLQVTVLKDLVTVENPRSGFTFLSYLKEKGRLYDFLNLRTLFPTRVEFNDYLGWAAEKLDRWVCYGRQVVEILPAAADGSVTAENPELLRVMARDAASGRSLEYLTRHLVLAAGAEPVAPAGIDFRRSPRVFHSHHFLDRIRAFPDREAPYRFVVVGSGQSAGELFEYLMDHYPNADVTAAVRRFAYKPVDESDFTNRIFFPEWVDYYHDLPGERRRAFFADLKDVNYAAIDHPLIRRIYEKLYRQKVRGHERCRLRPFLELERVTETGSGLAVECRDVMQGGRVALAADALVLCTGYEWRKEHPLLDALAPWFERDDLGGYAVKRDYAIAARGGFRPNVYLQGYCEDTHGISETVLSLLPVRAKEILTSILASRATSREMAVGAAGVPAPLL